VQAPVWQVKVKKLDNTFNYAEALFNQGYLVDGGVPSMAKAWRNLFDFIKPDLLIVDHAPTALIGARGTAIKTALFGTGFCAPPRQNPMPSLIPWVTPPGGLLEYSEKKAVRIINHALAELGSPELQSLEELFAVDENILATFKELDHYQTREETRYWGPVINLPEGGKPDWPATDHSKKIFCYLKPTYPHLEEVLRCLQQIKASVIIFLPKAPKAVIERFHSATLKFAEKPLNMAKVCEECDMVICHAGHGTVSVNLLHGKPLMLLPEHNQLEQVLMARNIAAQKLGLCIFTRQKARDYKGAINRILSETEFTAEAREFAGKYKEFKPAKQLDEIADRCEELINPGSA
jgi:UDP:flavonoid glycosyltransferase YjiC (YdhE family)